MRNNRIATAFILAFFTFFSLDNLTGQAEKKSLDREAILSMTGCYNVDFKYTETFAPEIDYEHAYDYTSAAFEWAELVEKTEDRIVIQHLLIINDSVIIKHWRQDWVFESDRCFSYDKDNRWIFSDLNPGESTGKWTQFVYQVDDSPRYCGTATWSHIDGISSWYNRADSPLPRREYSKRDDYNVMNRGNRVIITDNGWVHEQDNNKIIREDLRKDVLLVQEKGFNTYEKREDADCLAAQKWWSENAEKWAVVREVWDGIYDESASLELHAKLEGKRLYEDLFYGINDMDRQEIEDHISAFIIKNDKL